MSILPIYLCSSDILRKKAKPVTAITNEIIELVMDMFETMHNAQGIGLAANQVGRLYQIIVVDVSQLEEAKHIKPIVLINPEIISRKGRCVMEEGCLSIPTIRSEIERAERITVRYRDMNFKQQELQADDILARVILHEYDHLQGVLFLDYLSSGQLKQFKEKLQQIQTGEIEVGYPIRVTGKVPA